MNLKLKKSRKRSSMKFWKSTETQRNTEEILNQASKCQPEELENLLNQIQTQQEQSNYKNKDLRYFKSKNYNHIKTCFNLVVNNLLNKFLIIFKWYGKIEG